MKKYFLLLFCFAGLLSSNSGFSQTFTVTSDTVNITVSGSGAFSASDTVYSVSPNHLVILQWKAIASNFPPDWYACLGICDNHNCYSNSTLTTPQNKIWNGSSAVGYQYSNAYPASGTPGTIELSMSCAGTTTGTFYITVGYTDTTGSGYSKNVTFIVNRWSASVPSVPRAEDDIMVYPNPAHNEVNIVYGTAAGVKTIAIYNIIGKVMNVFKPIDNSSAKLATDNIPAGIYFIRLMDAQGAVIATRKFTRQ